MSGGETWVVNVVGFVWLPDWPAVAEADDGLAATMVVVLPETELVDELPAWPDDGESGARRVGILPGDTPPGNAEGRPPALRVSGSTTARTKAVARPQAIRTFVLKPHPEITALSHPIPSQYFTAGKPCL